MQCLRAENNIDIRRPGHNRRAFLARNTTTHRDHQIGLAFLEQADAAKIMKNLLLRLLAHRAGIKDDDIRVFRRIRLDNFFRSTEYVGHFVRIVLVHLAPEGTDEQFFGHLLLD